MPALKRRVAGDVVSDDAIGARDKVIDRREDKRGKPGGDCAEDAAFDELLCRPGWFSGEQLQPSMREGRGKWGCGDKPTGAVAGQQRHRQRDAQGQDADARGPFGVWWLAHGILLNKGRSRALSLHTRLVAISLGDALEGIDSTRFQGTGLSVRIGLRARQTGRRSAALPRLSTRLGALTQIAAEGSEHEPARPS